MNEPATRLNQLTLSCGLHGFVHLQITVLGLNIEPATSDLLPKGEEGAAAEVDAAEVDAVNRRNSMVVRMGTSMGSISQLQMNMIDPDGEDLPPVVLMPAEAVAALGRGEALPAQLRRDTGLSLDFGTFSRRESVSLRRDTGLSLDFGTFPRRESVSLGLRMASDVLHIMALTEGEVPVNANPAPLDTPVESPRVEQIAGAHTRDAMDAQPGFGTDFSLESVV